MYTQAPVCQDLLFQFLLFLYPLPESKGYIFSAFKKIVDIHVRTTSDAKLK